jgi:hypothetical protein
MVLVVDMFAEDRAHEELLRALVTRIAHDEGVAVHVRVRNALGGHGRVLQEYRLYQRSLLAGVGSGLPDICVVAIDANCRAYTAATKEIAAATLPELQSRAALACPDPHIERWYLADPVSFHRVIGITPRVEQAKCERNRYKHILARAVVSGGFPPTLGGIEFAVELVEAMDLYRAGRNEPSLRHFIGDLRAKLRAVRH